MCLGLGLVCLQCESAHSHACVSFEFHCFCNFPLHPPSSCPRGCHSDTHTHTLFGLFPKLKSDGCLSLKNSFSCFGKVRKYTAMPVNCTPCASKVYIRIYWLLCLSRKLRKDTIHIFETSIIQLRSPYLDIKVVVVESASPQVCSMTSLSPAAKFTMSNRTRMAHSGHGSLQQYYFHTALVLTWFLGALLAFVEAPGRSDGPTAVLLLSEPRQSFATLPFHQGQSGMAGEGRRQCRDREERCS